MQLVYKCLKKINIQKYEEKRTRNATTRTGYAKEEKKTLGKRHEVGRTATLLLIRRDKGIRKSSNLQLDAGLDQHSLLRLSVFTEYPSCTRIPILPILACKAFVF